MPPDPVSFDSRLSHLQIEARESRRGGSEPPPPPPPSGLEPRVARLEASVGHIERDVANIHGGLKDIRTEIKAEIRDFRTEIKSEVKELRLGHERDFRLLFGALIAAVLGLAGLMAKGFHWL